jgi:nicotinate-nucleotide adenylyltransferase
LTHHVTHLARPHSNWLRPPGPVAPGLRIGLLGGSFNPPHEGHLYASQVALKRLGLDYVWWLVSPQNPLKPVVGMAPMHDRMADAAALARHPRIIVMDIEHTLGTRYTVDTLAAIRRRFPQLHFVWLMGSDNLRNLCHWRRWPEILARVPVAVVLRPGSVLATLHAKPIERFAGARRPEKTMARAKPPAIAILDGRRNPQSSTALRAVLVPTEAMVGAIPSC